MKALRQSYREANQQLISDFHAKRREFAGLKRAGDPRAEEVKAQLKAIREQVHAAREATHQQVLGLLTANSASSWTGCGQSGSGSWRAGVLEGNLEFGRRARRPATADGTSALHSSPSEQRELSRGVRLADGRTGDAARSIRGQLAAEEMAEVAADHSFDSR